MSKVWLITGATGVMLASLQLLSQAQGRKRPADQIAQLVRASMK